jgi:RNA polymerase sigma-70 factor (ECF subfamily)
MIVEDDAALIARLQARDERALAELYDATSRRAFGLAYRILGDGAAAEDVLQTAYLGLWERAEEIDRSRGSVESLLMTIVHRRAVDAVRARVRRREDGAIEVDPADETPGAAERLVEREAAGEVRAALEALPETQRRVVLLAYFEGLTYREVAEREAVPVGTVKSRMRLALERLREALAPTSTASTASEGGQTEPGSAR